jgi:predicted nucleotidyltransferase
VKLKKYLYVIRALLARKYVLEHRLPPPLPIVELLPMFGGDGQAKQALVELIKAKGEVGELGMGEPVEALNDFIAFELGHTHIFKEVRDDRRADRLVEELYTSTVYGPFRHDCHGPC